MQIFPNETFNNNPLPIPKQEVIAEMDEESSGDHSMLLEEGEQLNYIKLRIDI